MHDIVHKYYFEKFSSPNILAESLFVDQDAHKAIMNLRHVNRPFVSYIGGEDNIRQCEKNILYIGIMETLSEDFDNICKLLNIRQI